MSYALKPNQPINFNDTPEELEKTGKLYLLYTIICFLFAAIFSYSLSRTEGGAFFSYLFIVYGIASGVAAYFFLRQAIKIRRKKEQLKEDEENGKQK